MRAHVAIRNLVHDVDQIPWSLPGQRCEKVYAVERYVTGRPFPDLNHAILQFSEGTIVTLETGWTVPDGAPANILSDNWGGHIDASLDIVGTVSTAELRVFRAGLTIWGETGSIVPNLPLAHGQIGGALRDEDMHFLRTVRTARGSSLGSWPCAPRSRWNDPQRRLDVGRDRQPSALAGTVPHFEGGGAPADQGPGR